MTMSQTTVVFKSHPAAQSVPSPALEKSQEKTNVKKVVPNKPEFKINSDASKKKMEKITHAEIYKIISETIISFEKTAKSFNDDVNDELTTPEALTGYLDKIKNLLSAARTEISQKGGDHTSVQRANDVLQYLEKQYTEVTNQLKPPTVISKTSTPSDSTSSYWQENRLRLEQQLLLNPSTTLAQRFNSTLELIRKQGHNDLLLPNSVFICYAWPDQKDEAQKHLSWVQPFLLGLRQHLQAAGIANAKLDIRDNPPGGNIYDYMRFAETADFVLLIGTESLLKKHQIGTSAVCTELININRKREKDVKANKYRVFPIMISGDYRESFPAHYELYTTVKDWKGTKTYFQHFQWLVAALYSTNENAFIETWKKFLDKSEEHEQLILTTGLDEQSVLDKLEAEKKEVEQKKVQKKQASRRALNLEKRENIKQDAVGMLHSGVAVRSNPEEKNMPVSPAPQPKPVQLPTSLAIGNSDYKSAVMQGGLLVDKTLFIKEVIDDKTLVKLIIRPRRFGKTLNMSMLRYFFEKTDKTNEHAGLFFNTAICKAGKQYQDEQGQYPVLFITMKDVKAKKYKEAEESIRELLSTLYKQYKELLFNGVFKNDADEQKDYQTIIDCKGSITQTKNALKKLTGYLQKASGKQVIVLIDEYDTPFNASYEYHYYPLMADFMRGILSPLLKDNLHLYRAVLTGILRVAKESIFSGLNNVRVYSALSDSYATQFGFSANEVKDLLKNTTIPSHLVETIEDWYGGYQMGSQKLFNPWSIINFIEDNRRVLPENIQYRSYWLNTSENNLVSELLVKSDDLTKKIFKDLLANKPTIQEISEHTVFTDITKNPQTLWSFLFLCGYLTVKPGSKKLGEEKTLGEFVVVNKELYGFYETLTKLWLIEENPAVASLRQHLVIAQTYKERLSIAAKLIDLHAVDNALVHVLLQSFGVNINKEDQAQARRLLIQHDVIKYIMSIDKEAGETLGKSTQHGDQSNVFKYAVTPLLRKLAINKSENTNELTQYLQQLIADNRNIKIQGMADDMRYKIALDKIYIDLELDPVTRSDMANLLRRFEKTQLVNILAQSVDDAHAVQHTPLLSNKTPELQRDQKQSVPLLIVPKDEKTVTDSVLPVALRKQFLRIVKSLGYKYGQSPTENFWAEIWNAGKLTREDQDILLNVLYRLEDKMAEFASSIKRKRMVEPKELFLSVAQAYQKNRHMIILGDPGAGKTTVAQWLTLKMASALEDKNNPGLFEVDSSELEFSKTEDSGQHSRKLTMGKLRLPIFVRLSEYVEHRAKDKIKQIKSSLADFLIARAEKKAEATIKDCLNNGTVLLILDGFDEVPNALERDKIGRDIDQFIGTSVFKDEKGLFEQSHDIDSGNRLIITSRIVGNYVAKLDSEWPRLTIKAMSLASIKQYFAHWMQAIYGAGQVAQKNADALFALVREDDRLLDLAKTPQLANLIAMVYQKTNSLPRTRTGLYKLAITSIMENWRKQIFARSISRDEKIIHAMTDDIIFRLLEPIAAEMQSRNSTISEEEMKTLSPRLEEYIKAWVGKPQEIVRIFLDSIWHEVGLLTAFGIGEYRFLHRSFQEYLAGRYLVSDDKNAASCLLEKLPDPIWHEPLLMAIGYISAEKSGIFKDILLTLLKQPLNNLSAFLPTKALLVAEAFSEITDNRLLETSVKIVFVEMMEQLLNSYKKLQHTEHASLVCKNIEYALVRLCKAGYRGWIEKYLGYKLVNRDDAPAVALLIQHLSWFTPSLNTLLIAALPFDKGEKDWPINGALQKALRFEGSFEKHAAFDDKIKEVIHANWEKAPDQIMSLINKKRVEKKETSLSQALITESLGYIKDYQAYKNLLLQPRELQIDTLNILSMRQRLRSTNNTDLLTRVKNNPDWLRVVSALYGGYQDFQVANAVREYSEIASYLRLDDNQRTPFLEYYKSLWTSDDAIYEMAVYLDKHMEGKTDAFDKTPDFDPRAIYRDSTLTYQLLQMFEGTLTQEQFSQQCLAFWQDGSNAIKQQDACIALIALGHPDVSALLSNANDTLRQAVLKRLAEIDHNLQDPVCRIQKDFSTLYLLATAEKTEETEETLALSLLNAFFTCMRPDAHASEEHTARPSTPLLRSLFSTLIRQGGRPINPFSSVSLFTHPDEQAYLLSEYLAMVFTGNGDDTVYNAAVCADSTSKLDSRLMLRTLMLLPYASQLRKPTPGFSWSMPTLMPYTVDPTDIPMAVFDMLETAPKKLSFIRPWAINQVLLGILQQNIQLIPEALVILATDMGEQSDGYLDQFRTLLTVYQAQQKTSSAGKDAKQAPEEKLSSTNLKQIIYNRIQELTNPYHEARAWYRLAKHYGTSDSPDAKDNFDHTTLYNKAKQAAEKISDKHQRIQVLEHLLLEVKATHSQELFIDLTNQKIADNLMGIAYRTIQEITDLADKALALGRLAFHLDKANRDYLLAESMSITKAIADNTLRNDVMRLLQPLWLTQSAEVEKSMKHAGSASDSQAAMIFPEQPGKTLLNYETLSQASGKLPLVAWALISLSALVHDVRVQFDSTVARDRLWLALRKDPTSKMFLAVQDKIANQLEPLSKTAAIVLDELINEGYAKLVGELLLPHLTQVELEVLPVLKRWAQWGVNSEAKKEHKLIAGCASLLMVEMHSINVTLLPNILFLIEEYPAIDILRHRVFCVIHHPNVTPPKEPTKRLSVLGQNTVELIAKKSNQYYNPDEPKLQLGIRLRWFSHDLLMDDQQTVIGWLSELDKASSQPTSPTFKLYQQLISQIERVDAKVLTVLLDHLTHEGCQSQTQLAIIKSLIRIERFKNGTLNFGDVVARISQLDKKLLVSQSYLKYGSDLDEFFRSIKTLFLNKQRNLDQITAEEIEAHILSNDTENFSSLQDVDNIQKLFNRMGSLLYVNKDDSQRWVSATEKIQQYPKLLLFLMRALSLLLAKSPNDENHYLSFRHNLLCITAGAAQHLPELFANITYRESPEWFTQEEIGCFKQQLITAATSFNSFPARGAALKLLGQFAEPALDIMKTIERAIFDEPFVNECAFQVVNNLNQCHDRRFIEELIAKLSLDNPEAAYSPEVAYVIIKILKTIANRPDCPSETKNLIITTLVKCLDDDRAKQFVYFYFADTKIPDLPRLDAVLYEAVLSAANFNKVTHRQKFDTGFLNSKNPIAVGDIEKYFTSNSPRLSPNKNSSDTQQADSKKMLLISLPPAAQPAATQDIKVSHNVLKTPTPDTSVHAWHLPMQSNAYFIERKTELNLLQERFKDTGSSQKFAVCVVLGMVGSGKTALVCHYLQQASQRYSARVWFRADNVNQLLKEYRALALQLKLIDAKTSAVEVIFTVKNYLERQQNVLVVYDNAGSRSELEKLLPQKNAHLIITTYRREWHSFAQAVVMNSFNEADAVLFLKKSMVYDEKNVASANNENALRVLAHRVGCLPSALVQISAYGKKYNKHAGDFKAVADTELCQLLSDKKLSMEHYDKSVGTAWDNDLRARLQKNMQQANKQDFTFEIIIGISLLNSTSLSCALLEQWLVKIGVAQSVLLAKPVVNKFIQALDTCSLIEMDAKKEVLTLHPLLRLVYKHAVVSSVDTIKHYDHALAFLQAHNQQTNADILDDILATFVVLLQDKTNGTQQAALSILGQLKSPSETVVKALRGILQSNDSNTINLAGNLLFNWGNYDEALFYYEAAIKLEPHAAYHSNKGNTLSNLKRYEEALICYEAALKLEPNNADYKNNVLFAVSKNKAENLRRLEVVVQPAILLALEKQDEKYARVCFQEHKLNFDDPQIHEGITDLYYQKNKARGAIVHLGIALRLLKEQKKEDTTARRHLAGLQQNLGCFYHSYACEQQKIGDVDQASDALKEADKFFQAGLDLVRYAGIQTEYGQYLLRQQRIPEAIQQLATVLILNKPDSKQANKDISYRLLDRPTLDATLQAELDFWQTTPQEAPSEVMSLKATTLAHYLLVTAYHQQANLEQAHNIVNAFQKIALTERDPLTFSLLGHTQQLMKDNVAAAMSYQQALSLKPDYTVAKQGRIQALFNTILENKHEIQSESALESLHSIINATTALEKHTTAFLLAAGRGDIPVMQWLLEHGASMKEITREGDTALLEAASSGHRLALQWLLQNGASVKEINNEDGWTALLWAARENHRSVVTHLLQNGASIKEADKQGITALQLAAYGCHIGMVQYLLEHGASLNEVDAQGTSPLLWAVLQNRRAIDVTKYLLKKIAEDNRDQKQENAELYQAAWEGNKEVVQKSLTQGMNQFATRQQSGSTAILLAAAAGRLEVVQYLIGSITSAYERQTNSNAALLWASSNGHLSIVRWLVLEEKASLTVCNVNGFTSLLLSTTHGHIDTVKFLVERGANINEKNNWGKNALKLARERNYAEMVMFLKTHSSSHAMLSSSNVPILTVPENQKTTDRGDQKSFATPMSLPISSSTLFKQTAPKIFFELLNNSKTKIRQLAAFMLVHLQSGTEPAVVKVLVETLCDTKDWLQGGRKAAAIAISRLDKPDASVTKALLEVLQDKNINVRQIAMDALDRWGIPHPVVSLVSADAAAPQSKNPDVQALLEVLQNKALELELRIVALDELAQSKTLDDATVTTLHDILQDKEDLLSTKAKEMLLAYNDKQNNKSSLQSLFYSQANKAFLEDPRQNSQHGWNCFDLAVGLDQELKLDEKDSKKRAQVTRDKLVAFALDEKNISEFRRLLAPEIRHAAGLTAVYLNLQKDKENADKARNTRLAELFGVAEALAKARSNEASTQAVVTQQISKLLAEDDRSKSDVDEINLDRHTLPKSLQTETLRKLVNDYQGADEVMQKAIKELCAQYPEMQTVVTACKQTLSQAQNNRVIAIISAEELYQFLQTPERQKQYPVAWGAYCKQYLDNFAKHEQALQAYCEDEKTYRTYVNDYYGKQGWIAFQRSFKAEGTSTSMVDIAARLLNSQIVVCQKNPTIQNAWEEIYCTATPVQNNKKVYVQFNGRDHFIALQENPAYAKNWTGHLQQLEIFNITADAGIVDEKAPTSLPLAAAKARVDTTNETAALIIHSFIFHKPVASNTLTITDDKNNSAKSGEKSLDLSSGQSRKNFEHLM